MSGSVTTWMLLLAILAELFLLAVVLMRIDDKLTIVCDELTGIRYWLRRSVEATEREGGRDD